MKVKITRNAAKVLKRELDLPENEGKLVRVLITLDHGDHVHYGIDFDTQKENDELVSTDKEIDVLLEKGKPMLENIKVDYLYFPREGFVITDPSQGNNINH
ncbi:hypothetical protein J45TS6_17950 [Paenibacillus sp. J45TS6]|uniref:Iron-sulfur cluster assembly accessory protein n=2 Tax=Paenibacillus TaxID=44249 RepID=A0ABY8XBP5_9BACL|nr:MULTISPECIES: iron-sulfur cluster assembly accessory protein [Paenibacillus]MBD7967038.1 iron-sulfur cluster assembly accessory protein [Paenibacillus gallinarum]WIV20620.1 iron-sulfur cluster assembly accessory protein [Paenibacillus polygoni]GIP43336.1 hypothetical protein J45TS6_17950 [Paenibacillus sp. J45TS6]